MSSEVKRSVSVGERVWSSGTVGREGGEVGSVGGAVRSRRVRGEVG